MSRILLASFVFALSATGCVINGGGDDGPDPDPNPNPNTMDAGTTTSVVPHTGAWYYADVTPVSSSCSSAVDGVAGEFVIDAASALSFHVIPGDGTDPFTCNLSGASFDCPDRAWRTEDLRPAVDAVLTAHATATGTFSSSIRGSGRQEANVTCTGSQCGAIGQWPCSFKVDFVIAAR